MIKTWITWGFWGWLALMVLIITIKIIVGYRFSDKSLIVSYLSPYRSWRVLQWIFRWWTLALLVVGLYGVVIAILPK